MPRRKKKTASPLFETRIPEPFGGWPRAVLVIRIGERVLYASFEDNPSAAAFRNQLSVLTLEMKNTDGESVGALPWALPETDKKAPVAAGDIVLRSDTEIAIVTRNQPYSAVRLARIGNVPAELADWLREATLVGFSPEWSE